MPITHHGFVLQGLQRPNYATDAVGVLLKEIKNNSRLVWWLQISVFISIFFKYELKPNKEKGDRGVSCV